MFARKPLPRATQSRVNLVEDEQCGVLGANTAQQREESLWRDVDAAARLNRLDNHGANLRLSEKIADSGPGGGQVVVSRRKRDPVTEFTELRAERTAKVLALSGIERAVAKAVVAAFKRDDPGPAAGEQGGF